jgi:uncharacterized repeat protein (TIGR03809 family)
MPAKMIPATTRLHALALRWRNLAERRREHHLELYKSGRWRRYYSDEQFLEAMRESVALAERWAAIAPWPDERAEADAAKRPAA